MPQAGAAPTCASRSRRAVLRQGGLLAVLAACGLLESPLAHAAAEDMAFDAKTVTDVLARLGGRAATATEVVLTLDEVIDNGAIVPVSVECALPRVEDIYIVVEGNPAPLAVRFRIPEGTDAFVATRLKLAQSGRVHAIARADGRLYATSRDTKVVVSGCE